MTIMNGPTHTFTVIYIGKDRRMHPCPHTHLTAESAHKCVRELDGISIMEWIMDRRPQFAEFWRAPDIDER